MHTNSHVQLHRLGLIRQQPMRFARLPDESGVPEQRPAPPPGRRFRIIL